MEIWDAYLQDGSLAGCDLERGQPIPEGLFHLVCEVLVQHVDGTFLLMQRDFNKEGFPGMFEATAGGSVLRGETPRNACFRELQEETGIIASELTKINKSCSYNTIYYCYLCVTDCDKSSITLQEGETISYRWVSREDFLAFMNSSECISAQKERLAPYIEKLKEDFK